VIVLFLFGFYLRNETHAYGEPGQVPEYVDIATVAITDNSFGKCRMWNQTDCLNLEDLEHPWGYPFLLSLMFRITGIDSTNAMIFSSFLNSMVIVLIFMICYLLFKNELTSLISSLVFAVIPIERVMAATTNAEPVSEFFVACTLVAFLLSMKIDTKEIWVLFLLILSYSLKVKQENAILLIILPIGLFLLDYKISFRKMTKLLLPIAIFLLVSIPFFVFVINHALHGYYGPPTSIPVPAFHINYFLVSAPKYANYYFTKKYFTPFLSGLFFAGLFILSFRNKKYNFLRFLFLAYFLLITFHFHWDPMDFFTMKPYASPPLVYMLHWNIAYSIIVAVFSVNLLNCMMNLIKKASLRKRTRLLIKVLLASGFVVFLLANSKINFYTSPKDNRYLVTKDNSVYATIENISPQCWIVPGPPIERVFFTEMRNNTYKIIAQHLFLDYKNYIKENHPCIRYLKKFSIYENETPDLILSKFNTTYLYHTRDVEVYDVKVD
jgi:4-amino-4-deoxy-L-arabinose transferase-like glycosyltransferase